MSEPEDQPSGSTSETRPPIQPRGRPRKRDTFTISFRVDTAHQAALGKAAEELGMSVHEYARLLTYQGLDHTFQAQMVEEMQDVRGEIRVLRDELLEGVALLLNNMVEEEPSAVRSVVTKTLRRDRGRKR